MEGKAFKLTLEKNPLITLDVLPGHFTTSNTHVSHYLDLGGLKSNALLARNVARELAIPYLSNIMVDTIVCTERTEVIGAYLAEELFEGGISVINSWEEIHIVTPRINNTGHLSFPGSMIQWVSNRNIILLATSISSGRTLDSALDCLSYYQGIVVGISTLFMVKNAMPDQEVNTLFTSDDIPEYKMYSSRDCEMCRQGLPLDALVCSEGYTIL